MERLWFDSGFPIPDRPISAPGNPGGYLLTVELGIRACTYLHDENVDAYRPYQARWKRLHSIRRRWPRIPPEVDTSCPIW